MHRWKITLLAAGFMLLIASLSTFAQTADPTDQIAVKSSQGRAYYKNSRGGWSGIFSGRTIPSGRIFVVPYDAAVVIEVGAYEISFGPISVTTLTDGPSDQQDTPISIELAAGELQVRQLPGKVGRILVRTPFGTVDAAGSDFDLDGNRLVVRTGRVQVENTSGRKRLVEEGEELLIEASAPLKQPTRSDSPRSR